MIEELRITDLGVINEASIALHPGLTVVTGETGAGKTMIVTGMGLLLGGRSDPRTVRSGAARARVEGRFTVSDSVLLEAVLAAGGELDDADELLVARHVTASGRSRAYVGGAQVPAAVCAGIAESLITIHGQSEQVRLASADRQREILDRFAGPDLLAVLSTYGALFAERRVATSELVRLRTEAQSRAREIDLLRFGLEEIEKVDPQSGEDVALSAEAHRLQSVDDLRLSGEQALLALTGGSDDASGADQVGAVTGIAVARKAADQLAVQDPTATELARRVAEAGYLVDDLAGDLARYLDDLAVEPGRLESIAERRSALAGLTRKYGSRVDEVLSWGSHAVQRLVELESSDDTITTLAAQVTRLDTELVALAAKITVARAAAATGFSQAVMEELAALAMPHARLVFALAAAELGPHGADQVDLLFSANPGTDPRSLAKTASGGELSRVRLALEVVLAAGGQSATFVFDEVDAGVGGKVAVEIGRRLAVLAEHSQVVVVTHLAQVAAFADRHFVVVKSDDGQITTSGVVQVADDQRAAELARMMAGLETTDSALAHAKELVAVAGEVRRSVRA